VVVFLAHHGFPASADGILAEFAGSAQRACFCTCEEKFSLSPAISSNFFGMKLRGSSRWLVILAIAAIPFALAWRVDNRQRGAMAHTAAEKIVLTGLPNAGKVSDFLYRGAQPRGAGFQELKRLGVSIVVDLRSSTDQQGSEQRVVESLGIRHVAIPTNGWLGPTDQQVATFLKLLRDNAGKKAFVHCYFGDDRTGAMVAAYRMAEQRWTADQAYNEMREFHFHTYLVVIGHYVKNFPATFATGPAFASLRTAAPAN
jgi:tyrosine-protein phosphatase SIW14